ncbi:MAG: phosphohistidine phosphatase SixA [Acidobacteria bacterium]|nr:phosphohistidine phosphatase SixA [Acidobacteriota bacterium]
MILYIVRHSDAVPSGTPGVSEDQRPLTDKGIRKMREVARGLRLIGVQPELIFTSPLPRARQTADIVAEETGGLVEVAECLAPAGSRPELYRELRAHRKQESLMIVGHQPSLGEIAGEIAWGSPDHCLEIKKGGACALELTKLDPAPTGTLLWLVTPALLRRVES